MFNNLFYRVVKPVKCQNVHCRKQSCKTGSNTEDCWGLDEKICVCDSSLFPHKLFQQSVTEGNKSLILDPLSHHRLSKWQERSQVTRPHSLSLEQQLCDKPDCSKTRLMQSSLQSGLQRFRLRFFEDSWCPVGPHGSNHLEKYLQALSCGWSYSIREAGSKPSSLRPALKWNPFSCSCSHAGQFIMTTPHPNPCSLCASPVSG